MAQQLMSRGEVLDELEEHLRDEVDALTESGLAPDDAVQTAVTRLGDPADLAAEFAKVPPATAPWLPVRLAWVGGALLTASMLAPLWPRLTAGGLTSLLAAHMGAVMLGYVATLLVGFLAVCALVARPFGGLSEGQVQTLRRSALSLTGLAVALTGVGIVVGSVFCPDAKTGWAWGLDTREVGGIGILAWNVAMLAGLWANRDARRVGALALLGVAGNVVVFAGWLGASAVERVLHGTAGNFAPVAALILAQVAVGLVALAPAGCLRRERA